MSNVLGTVNPIPEIAALAHAVGAVLVVDASQAVPQIPVDVSTLGADLVAFTGHKMVGPTGIGVLWGRYDLLAELPPFLGGGEMIEVVKMTGSTYAPPPHRFEAGTPPIAQAVGLGAAAHYLSAIGMATVAAHEQEITGVRAAGPGHRPTACASSVRPSRSTAGARSPSPCPTSTRTTSANCWTLAGSRCAAATTAPGPLHERFGVQSSTRASFYLYTTTAEIDALVDGLGYVQRFFGGGR